MVEPESFVASGNENGNKNEMFFDRPQVGLQSQACLVPVPRIPAYLAGESPAAGLELVKLEIELALLAE